MNVAKWLLATILMLPVLELAVFILVAALIGFGWALLLIAATSFAGMLVLKYAGGAHVERVRTALGASSFSALRADAQGSLVLFAGILLLIPGFITGILGFALLVRAFTSGGDVARREDGVVDLEPEQWHRVPDRQIPDRHDSGR
jgi:UPF0716 protein FxsA